MFDNEMNIKNGPFGIEESEGCWNSPSISFIFDLSDKDRYGRPKSWMNGNYESMNGVAPKARGGCCGVVEMDNSTFHFMGEDDDHYHTTLICSRDDLRNIKEIAKAYTEIIDAKIDYVKATTKMIYPKGVKALKDSITKGDFTAYLIDRSPGDRCIVKFNRHGEEHSFHSVHVSWLKDLVAVLKDI